MKLKDYPVLLLYIFTVFFLFSCAGYQDVRLPEPALSENLPQIGTRQAALPKIKTRPSILVTMIEKAENELRFKKFNAAFTTLERALGIDNRDPLVWHLMARARLMQGNLLQAEYLARKSNTLVGESLSLRKKNWALIAEVLEKQGRTQEAAEAQKKAQE